MPQPAAVSCYLLSVMPQPLADMFQMIIDVLIMTNSNTSMYCLDQCS